MTAEPGEPREGYCMISLAPNLGGTGNVPIISGTGGSAVSAGGDFLGDDQAVSQLRGFLPAGNAGRFPHFEALLKIKSRSSLPRDVTIVLCRVPRT